MSVSRSRSNSDASSGNVQGSPETVIVDGRQYTPTTRHEKRSVGARIARGALGSVATVATFGLANISTRFRDVAWGTHTEKEHLVRGADPLDEERDAEATDGHSNNALEQRLGYDPKDQESIGRFMQQAYRDGRCILSNGNLLFIEERRKGVSTVLFVPGMDYTKADSIRMCDAKTGKALAGTELERAMNTYSAQYQDMKEGIDKAATKIAKRVCKQRNLGIDENLERVTEIVKKRMCTVVLDHKQQQARVFGRVDPNIRSSIYTNLMRGTRITWSKGTKKNVREIHRAVKKRTLPTPIKWPTERPPQPSQVQNDDNDSDDNDF